MSQPEPRFLALSHWLQDCLQQPVDIELISGDASFRRYYRVLTAKHHFILMDSPPTLLPIEPFLAIAKAYAKAGIFVPEVVAYDVPLGAVLLSDLGDEQLLSALTLDSAPHFYQQALDWLPAVAKVKSCITISAGDKESVQSLPCFDADFIDRELTIFRDWFIGRHLDLSLSETEQQMVAQVFAQISDVMLQQPQIGMHRDFHSRNLMIVDKRLAVIDFQDAVIGPLTYDCVSLLKDCYVRWPDTLVERMSQYHYQQCIQHSLLSPEVDYATYEYWFDVTGLQRHLKVLGIFCRLNYRDNKPAYMADIPLTLSYIQQVTQKYAQFHQFHQWMQQRVLPVWEARL